MAGRIDLLLVLPLLAAAPGHALQFTPVTQAAGILHTFTLPAVVPQDPNDQSVIWMMGGCVAEDFNNDGWVDLYVMQGGAGSNLLYMNRGDGTFTNEASQRGLDLAVNAMGAAAADYDNDGDIDVCLTVRRGRSLLLVNDPLGGAPGYFTNRVVLSGPTNYVFGASWGDRDRDGLLELVVGRWADQGTNLFLYAPSSSGLVEVAFREAAYADRWVYSPRFADFDNDRRQDLAVTADFLASELYMQNASGRYHRATQQRGVGTDENGMGAAIGDYDNDGDLDWFVSSIRTTLNSPAWGKSGNRLYRNDGHGFFEDRTDAAGVRDGNWGWGSAFGDLDNDGHLDLYHVNGYPPPQTNLAAAFNNAPALLFRNRGDGTFTDVALEAGADDRGQGRGLILFDYDNDGDLDLFIANNQVLTFNIVTNIFNEVEAQAVRSPGLPLLLRNDTPASNRWLKVELEGAPPHHRNGIGSRVYVRTGSLTQFRELDAGTGYLGHGPGRIAHFGLRTNTLIDEVRAEWNTGAAVVLTNIPVNQALRMPSPVGSLSAQALFEGESLTASASSASNTFAWHLEGTIYTNPASFSFATPGPRELELRIYGEGQPGPLRVERHRVVVLPPPATIMGLDARALFRMSELTWAVQSGRTYGVSHATNLLHGPWLPLDTRTAGATGEQSLLVTNSAAQLYYRVLETP